MKTAAAALAKWQSGMAGATQAYTDGVNAVQVAPGQLAANAKSRWQQNTAAAVDRFAANSARVDIGTWKQQTVSKGAPRLATGAAAAAPKMGAFLQNYLQWAASTASSLPARGDFATNMQRALAFATAAHNNKGNF